MNFMLIQHKEAVHAREHTFEVANAAFRTSCDTTEAVKYDSAAHGGKIMHSPEQLSSRK